jgi:hypothetical protein
MAKIIRFQDGEEREFPNPAADIFINTGKATLIREVADEVFELTPPAQSTPGDYSAPLETPPPNVPAAKQPVAARGADAGVIGALKSIEAKL